MISRKTEKSGSTIKVWMSASSEGLYTLLVNYRSGDMWSPQIKRVEALSQELAYFVDCISHDKTPMNDGAAGLRVVKMLEAASESLRQRGALVYL